MFWGWDCTYSILIVRSSSLLGTGQEGLSSPLCLSRALLLRSLSTSSASSWLRWAVTLQWTWTQTCSQELSPSNLLDLTCQQVLAALYLPTHPVYDKASVAAYVKGNAQLSMIENLKRWPCFCFVFSYCINKSQCLCSDWPLDPERWGLITITLYCPNTSGEGWTNCCIAAFYSLMETWETWVGWKEQGIDGW